MQCVSEMQKRRKRLMSERERKGEMAAGVFARKARAWRCFERVNLPSSTKQWR